MWTWVVVVHALDFSIQEEEKGRRQELTADSENLELQQQQQKLSIWVL